MGLISFGRGYGYVGYKCNVCGEKKHKNVRKGTLGGKPDDLDEEEIAEMVKDEAYEHVKREHPDHCLKDGNGNLFVTKKELQEYHSCQNAKK